MIIAFYCDFFFHIFLAGVKTKDRLERSSKLFRKYNGRKPKNHTSLKCEAFSLGISKLNFVHFLTFFLVQSKSMII